MKIIHNCKMNPNNIPQEYELLQPTGLDNVACHCGWCGNSYRLSNIHHEGEGYSNPFDQRGFFTPRGEVGRFGTRGNFYPIPEKEGEWNKLD